MAKSAAGQARLHITTIYDDRGRENLHETSAENPLGPSTGKSNDKLC